MRNKKGQFIKGTRASIATEFKKGEHWRRPQLFRKQEWLESHYVDQKIIAGDIAKMFGVTDSAIFFWLKKHDIKRRSISEARNIKHWGCSGVDNPMWNKRGELNPRWKGGITPLRQAFYMSEEWKTVCSAVWKRDKATCRRCGLEKKENAEMPFHIHHVVSFANEQLRATASNLVLVCETCHHFIHSKRNEKNEFIQKN